MPEEVQKNHLWRYIVIIFAATAILILSLLTYKNLDLLKAELFSVITAKKMAVVSVDTIGTQKDTTIINTATRRTATEKVEKTTNDNVSTQEIKPTISDTESNVIGEIEVASNNTVSTQEVKLTINDTVSTSTEEVKVITNELIKDFYIPSGLKATPGSSILIPVKNGKRIENLTAVGFKIILKPVNDLMIDISKPMIDLSSPAVFKGEYPHSLKYDSETGILLVVFKSLKRKYTLGANSTLFHIPVKVKSGLASNRRIQISIETDSALAKSISFFVSNNVSKAPTTGTGYVIISCKDGYTGTSCNTCADGYTNFSSTRGQLDCRKGSSTSVSSYGSGDVDGENRSWYFGSVRS